MITASYPKVKNGEAVVRDVRVKPNFGKIILVSVNSQYILHQCILLCFSEVDMLPAYGPYPPQTIEIINNTRGDIAILTSGKKRNAAIGGGGKFQVPGVYSCSHWRGV